nr:hypothetical protein [Novosphingobium sp. 9U]
MSVYFGERRLGCLSAMRSEEVKAFGLCQSLVQLCYVGATRRTGMQKAPRRLGDFVVVGVASRVEQCSKLRVSLARQQSSAKQDRFSTACDHVFKDVLEGRFILLAGRENMRRILDRQGTDTLKLAPDFHP